MKTTLCDPRAEAVLARLEKEARAQDDEMGRYYAAERQAAKRTTTTVPIVMLVGVDPVELGLVTSLAHPGGNLTGLTVTTREMTQKRLELLKEAVPSLSRVAWLWVAASPARGPQLELQALKDAAHVLGVPLVPLEVHGADDLDRLFEMASREGVHAVLTGQQPFFTTHRVRLAALALQQRLPLMSGEVGVAEAGGLLTYGPNIAELWRRGSVVSSWLLDLAARALAEDPKLDRYVGRVGDSGEGRWTVAASIEESVPADVLTTALYVRFRSRQDHTFAEKILSAMRHKFGGHVEPPKKP